MVEAVIKPCWGDIEGKRTLCRDWKSCRGHEWYEMKDIQYCRHQVLFLLNLIDFIGNGFETVAGWPEDPKLKETGYEDVRIQTSRSTHANYEAVTVITAELINRLERTGKDGRLLLFESRTRDSASELSQDARNALNYVAGWKRKQTSYRVWLSMRSYRKYNKEEKIKNNP
jgi:hypothetical protein